MNKQNYLNCIIKNLKATKQKKQEIYHDLCSEIDSALESGESWSDIEERMGIPLEIANEFNENLAEKDRATSNHTKTTLLIGGIVLGLAAISLIIFFTISNRNNEHSVSTNSATPVASDNSVVSDTFDVPRIKKNAMIVVELVNKNKINEIISKYSSQTLIEHGLSSKSLTDAKTQVALDAGIYVGPIQLESISEINNNSGHYVTLILSSKHKKRDVIYTLSFDSSSKLAGIYLK